MCIAHYNVALRNQKENKGEVTHPIIAQTNKHIARDTWMPSLENWGGGLKIICVHVYTLFITRSLVVCMRYT